MWQVLYYRTANGRSPAEEFINELSRRERQRIFSALELLESYGNELAMPHSRNLSGGLYELRVRGGIDYRVFYVLFAGQRCILLHGFVKKTQATPDREMDRARRYQADVSAFLARQPEENDHELS